MFISSSPHKFFKSFFNDENFFLNFDLTCRILHFSICQLSSKCKLKKPIKIYSNESIQCSELSDTSSGLKDDQYFEWIISIFLLLLLIYLENRGYEISHRLNFKVIKRYTSKTGVKLNRLRDWPNGPSPWWIPKWLFISFWDAIDFISWKIINIYDF